MIEQVEEVGKGIWEENGRGRRGGKEREEGEGRKRRGGGVEGGREWEEEKEEQWSVCVCVCVCVWVCVCVFCLVAPLSSAPQVAKWQLATGDFGNES